MGARPRGVYLETASKHSLVAVFHSLRVPDDVKPIAIGGLIDKKVSEMDVKLNPTSPRKHSEINIDFHII